MNTDFLRPEYLISHLIILLIALPIHELAHALTADRMGDQTPRLNGRVTLNPLAHLDPIGSLLLMVAGFGWAKPVPVNPRYLRPDPQVGMAIVAAAGPLSNLGLAILAAIPVRLGVLDLVPDPRWARLVQVFFVEFIFINLVLLLFNLIPLGPLDGAKVLRGFAPREWNNALLVLEQWGMFALMALVFFGGGILGVLIGRPANELFQLLTGL
jgi:Zn-dependent protease